MSHLLTYHWLGVGLDTTLWVALVAFAGASYVTRTGSANRGTWRLAFAAVVVGFVHHLLGWAPVEVLLNAMTSVSSDAGVKPLIHLNLPLRPSATIFYFNAVMCHGYVGSPGPWFLVWYLPGSLRDITYVMLASLDSLTVAGVLLISGTAYGKALTTDDDRAISGKSPQTFGSVARWAAFAGATVGGYHFVAQVQALHRHGSFILIELELPLFTLVGALAVATPVLVAFSMVNVLRGRYRRVGVMTLISLAVFWALLAADKNPPRSRPWPTEHVSASHVLS